MTTMFFFSKNNHCDHDLALERSNSNLFKILSYLMFIWYKIKIGL